MTALSVTPAPLETRIIEDRVLAAALSGLTPNSCRVYSAHLRNFLHYARTMGHPLNRETVERYTATVSEGSSFNQALSAIKRLAMQAAQHGWIDYAIAVQIDGIRTRTQHGTKGGNWLTLDQAGALLRAPGALNEGGGTIRDKRDSAVLALLLGCGLRRDELAKLNWSQVQQRDGRWMLIDIKGKGGRIRTIALSTWAHALLMEWGRAGGTMGLVVRSIRENGTINGSLSVTAIWDIVLHYARATGVTCTPHDLRRTFAKLARKSGAPLDVIQKSLGHASVRTTEIYTASGEEANAGDYFNL